MDMGLFFIVGFVCAVSLGGALACWALEGFP